MHLEGRHNYNPWSKGKIVLTDDVQFNTVDLMPYTYKQLLKYFNMQDNIIGTYYDVKYDFYHKKLVEKFEIVYAF